MNFINPISALGLARYESNEINFELVKKNKRKLLAEIELTDEGCIFYAGLPLGKSQVEELADRLSTGSAIKNYALLAAIEPLNGFIETGDTNGLEGVTDHYLLQQAEFKSFVSSVLVHRYGIELQKSFSRGDKTEFKKLLSLAVWLSQPDVDQAFRPLYKFLKLQNDQIREQEQNIQTEGGHFAKEKIAGVQEWIVSMVNIPLLNLLPEYFQIIRDQFAINIRGLAVETANELNNYSLSLGLLKVCLRIDCSSQTASRCQTDIGQVEGILARIKTEEVEQTLIKKYADLLKRIQALLPALANKSCSPDEITSLVRKNLDLPHLNGLDSSYREMRDTVALVLATTALSIYNNWHDLKSANEILTSAAQIVVNNPEVARKILETSYIFKKSTQTKEAAGNGNNVSKTGTSYSAITTGSVSGELAPGMARLIGIGALVCVIGIIIFIAHANTQGSYTPISTTSDSTVTSMDSATTTAPVQTAVDTATTVSSNYPAHENPPPQFSETVSYKGNQLENGASPFVSCLGKGKFGGHSWIQFENGNEFDAVVALVDNYTDRAIRHKYVRAGESYKMTKVPEGQYYLKVYYGNDWNPTLENFCGGKGAFETASHFSKSNSLSDIINITDDGYQYSTYRITLHTIYNGNMQIEPTSESDFFKN